ncbi:MAG: LamG-like jellyroll fold domain-containing protein, partial [Vulcanimicrobiaceae bacterium]
MRTASFTNALIIAMVAVLLASCAGGHKGGFLPPRNGSAATRLATTQDAYATAILADHPTAYYRLDDVTVTVADSSGNGFNGTAGSSVVENAPGLLKSSTDTAMRFPALKSAAGIVTVPQTSALQPTSAITVETLLRLNTAPMVTTIAVAYGSNSNFAPYALYFTATDHLTAQFNVSSGVATVTTSGTFNVGSTYDVVATFDGSVARLYVNGAQRASVSKSGTLTGYTTGFGLGL